MRREPRGERREKKVMIRKGFCLALCALLFTFCSSAEAQQPKKVSG